MIRNYIVTILFVFLIFGLLAQEHELSIREQVNKNSKYLTKQEKKIAKLLLKVKSLEEYILLLQKEAEKLNKLLEAEKNINRKNKKICDYRHTSITQPKSKIIGDSELITQDYLIKLVRWFKKAIVLRKIYQKKMGHTAKNFHQNVDYQGPTVVVIEVTSVKNKPKFSTQIIGGYNPDNWHQQGSYNSSMGRRAFIFNLTSSRVLLQTNEYTTYNRSDMGPTFGSGYDIQVNEELSGGHLRPETYWSKREIYNKSDPLGLLMLHGQHNVVYGRMEVFAVEQFNPTHSNK